MVEGRGWVGGRNAGQEGGSEGGNEQGYSKVTGELGSGLLQLIHFPPPDLGSGLALWKGGQEGREAGQEGGGGMSRGTAR